MKQLRETAQRERPEHEPEQRVVSAVHMALGARTDKPSANAFEVDGDWLSGDEVKVLYPQ